MTQQQFDNYKFNNKTEVKVDDRWFKVEAVDFYDKDILPADTGVWLIYSEIKDIRY